MSKINLAIADNHELFRVTLARYLDQSNDFNVVFTASNGSCLLDQLESTLPDIVILDISLQNSHSTGILEQMRKKYGKKIKVIVLSSRSHVMYLKKMMHTGANAYLGKDCKLKMLLDAIETVYRRGLYFDQSCSKELIEEIKSGNGDNLAAIQGKELTNREIEIVKLLCSGLSCPQIAEQIFLSVRTIENHKHKIFKKLGVKSPTAMMVAAIRCGYYVVDM